MGVDVVDLVASNIGAGNLTEVKVSDPQPGFTDFVSVSATTTSAGTVLYSTDGTTWSTTAPAGFRRAPTASLPAVHVLRVQPSYSEASSRLS